ncbi:MAG: molybdopterin-dependent oxidoreductase [Anaerolineae bacterium]|jgi:DMSO/TMAO reductase YedYZ molybdopterin-dependent catalytic subunit|nr:molybdopterin-dependent oxidoreductase [Anaerolineae bacterium]
MTENRLPPGQKRIPHFPVLQFGSVPQIDIENWRLRIWGEVVQPVELDLDTIYQLPQTEKTFDLHCVTRWTNYDTHWSGITLQTLLDEGIFELKPTAKFLIQHGPGFMTNLPISVAMAENFLLATHFEGEPITMEHGAPLRGLPGAIPGRGDLKDVYLWKGVKWLQGLQFTAEDEPGYWERRGYSMEADVWKEQRFAEKK